MATYMPEAKFVKELPEKFKCSICTNLLDSPVLTECCGQHFCKTCLEKWLARKKVAVCPHCRAEKFNRIVSHPMIREINELKVYCSNRENGCDKIIAYSSLQKHADECLHGVVECNYKCGIKRLLRKDLELHCKEKCFHRIVHCKLCNKEGKFHEIAGPHNTACPEVSLECPNKCGAKLRRKTVDHHKQSCPLEIVKCLFHEAGCDKQFRRRDMAAHEASSMQHHLQLTMLNSANEYKKLQSEHNKLQSEHKKLLSAHQALQAKFTSLSTVVSTEFDSLCSRYCDDRRSMLATAEADRIRSTLTSLTTMLKPGDTTYKFRLLDQPIFPEQEIMEVISKDFLPGFASPCFYVLCQDCRCRNYLVVSTLGILSLVTVYETDIPPGYDVREHLSVEICGADMRPLIKLSWQGALPRIEVHFASGQKAYLSIFDQGYFTPRSSGEYYVNVRVH